MYIYILYYIGCFLVSMFFVFSHEFTISAIWMSSAFIIATFGALLRVLIEKVEELIKEVKGSEK